MRGRLTLASLILAGLLASLPDDAWSTAAPRFDLDESAWQATHVVVATEGSSIDGVLHLLETWESAGNTADTLRLPPLAASALAASRRDHAGLRLAGARMVLFLQLTFDASSGTWFSESALASEAVCWLEGGQAYGMTGKGSLEGGRIGLLGVSDLALRSRVRHLTWKRGELARLRATPDRSARLVGASNLVSIGDRFRTKEVFELLASCGQAAVPLLVSHLDSSARYAACDALGAIGHASAVPPLIQRVEQELAFWKDAKQQMIDGAWRRGEHGDRVRRLHTLLSTLTKIPSRGYEDVVRRTLDLWSSSPVIREVPHGHISRACAKALRALTSRPEVAGP